MRPKNKCTNLQMITESETQIIRAAWGKETPTTKDHVML